MDVFLREKKFVPSTNAAWGGKGGSGLEKDAYLSFVGGCSTQDGGGLGRAVRRVRSGPEGLPGLDVLLVVVAAELRFPGLPGIKAREAVLGSDTCSAKVFDSHDATMGFSSRLANASDSSRQAYCNPSKESTF